MTLALVMSQLQIFQHSCEQMEHHRILRRIVFSTFCLTNVLCSPLAPAQQEPEPPLRTRSSCGYPEQCYEWTLLPTGSDTLSCDFDSVQQTSPNALLDPCPGWLRAFSLYPYRSEILPNTIGIPYSQFAQSKCYVKAALNSVYPDRKSATMRSAVFRPNGCVKLRTSFWYRMSAAPILTGDHDKDYFLELVVHHSADNAPGFIPTWQIWGSTSDYATFPGPNVWARVLAEYDADDQFTLNFYAHHGDTCNTTWIDLDGIDTRIAMPTECATTTVFPTTETTETSVFLPDTTPSTETTITFDNSTSNLIPISNCPLPWPCYGWITIRSCDMGTVAQADNSVTGIMGCSTPPTVTWYRGYRYYPYQFDLLKNNTGAGDIFAVSRCTRRSTGLTPGREEAVAVLRGPIIVSTACIVYRVKFWYRLSDYPVINPANPRDEFVLKVFVEDNGQAFPNDHIWGTADDYTGVNPNQWHFGQAIFGRDRGEQFTVNFLAYHNDGCELSLKTIALDTIQIENAVSVPYGSGFCTTTTPTSVTTSQSKETTAPPTQLFTTPMSPQSSSVTPVSQYCEFGPAIITRCSNGTVTMPAVHPDLSEASDAVFDGDNTYLCRTHLRNLHAWLLEQAARTVPHQPPHSFTTVSCQRGALQFSASDPDTAQSTGLQFRAATVDLKCRIIFAGFLTQLSSFSNNL
ncbi:uncharacterized protein LOC129581615 [Paramacrobiotus metropolitanus]|uniref:uncharacterized protein LOC129581615 n=1 Tax=Paramacrobiotus metropolitanus TaxID=2943436 RepID=UPI00244580B6|nr:uncharacterized protein LOC129581615 [Paramacrobiotus metropolitanus]